MNEKYFKEQQYTLRLPAILLLYPLFDVLLGIILLSIMITNQNIPGVIAVGVLFIAPMLLTLLLYAIYHITFNADGFSFRSATGKKYDYAYEDIIDIIPGTRFGKIIVKGRNIYVNAKNNQFRYFQEYADKKRGVIREADTGTTSFPKIRETKACLIIGIIASSFFLFLTYVFWINDQSSAPFVCIFFIIFALAGVYMIICYLRSAIYIDKYEIRVIEDLHRERRYDYKDLVAIAISRNSGFSGGEISLCFKTEKKDYGIVGIDSSDQCYKTFKRWLQNNFSDKFVSEEEFDEISFPEVVAAKRSYKESQERDAQKKNIWNGNIYFPTAATSFRNVIIIVCLVFIACHAIGMETIDQNDIVKEKVTFYTSSYKTRNPIEFLFSEEYFQLRTKSDEPYYWISHFSTYGKNQDLLIKEIDNHTAFYIKIIPYDHSKGIVECKDQYGNVFYTIDDAKKAFRKEDMNHIYVFTGIILLTIGLYILFIFIVRRLERMPRIIIETVLLFEEPSEKLQKQLPKGYYHPNHKNSIWK